MSSKFKDQTGREWTIQLDAPIVRRIRTKLGVGLTDLNEDPFKRLDIDPILFVDLLYLLCEKEAQSANISEDQFGEMVGDQLDDPRAALEDAIINFSPSSKRSLVRSLIEENAIQREQAMELAMKEVQASRPAMVKAMAKQSQRQLRKFLDGMESPSGEDERSSSLSTDSTPKPAATDSPE